MLTVFACGPFYEIWRPRRVHSYAMFCTVLLAIKEAAPMYSYAMFCTVLLAIKEAAPTNMVWPWPMCIVKTATLSSR
jgi:hypothetical protein